MQLQNKQLGIGKPVNRVDGSLKVTGGAQYAAEYPVEGLAHAVILQSTIAKGKITSIDTSQAKAVPGVIEVITHQNAPRLQPQKMLIQGGTAGETLSPLQGNQIYYSGQHIGVVVAETLEQATYAASLVEVEYQTESPEIDLQQLKPQAYEPQQVFGKPADFIRGDIEAGLGEAEVIVEQTYTTPVEHHNPMEPHATIVDWKQGDKITVYDSTQNTFGVRRAIATAFDLPEENIQVICKFVGGAFGCKGAVWPHVVIAAMAACQIQGAVKLVLKREQMFSTVGHRSATEQQVKLGATKSGKLTAIIHQGFSHTSPFDNYTEAFTVATHMLYQCPNLKASQRLVRANVGTPTFMRAPGETPGTFALESAMDELSYQLGIDPIELRLRNYAETDPDKGLPWSSKSLQQCYQIGAERFGWQQRNPEPGSMREGDYLIGMGMATATYPAYHFGASASVKINPDGSILVKSGTHDLGTGTITVMTQLAAQELDIPIEQVDFQLGDTTYPRAPVSGGSATVGSVGTAIHGAIGELKQQMIQLVVEDRRSPLYQCSKDQLQFESGRIVDGRGKGETYAEIAARYPEALETTYQAQFDGEAQYSKHAFGAQFAEVRVDPYLGEVRVTRYTGVFAAGRVLNRKTATSQLLGGIVMGIGMALTEETIIDARSGRIVNPNLAEYHVPVNADIPDVDIHIIEEHDPHVNPIGTKGIGEIGITGVAAAVANAVYHATGKRIRSLPITLDKVLA